MRAQTEKKSKPKVPSKGILATLKAKSERIADQVEDAFLGRPQNIEAAIKMDHESLRNYLKTLKNVDEDMKLRRRAYEQFAVLLKSHSLGEEGIVYAIAEKLPGRDMQIKIEEGYVEHQLANDLMARIEKAKDPMVWSAHANVLSEVVKHHLDEEERDLLPLIRKATNAKTDTEMLGKYLLLRGSTQKKVNSKNSGVLKIEK